MSAPEISITCQWQLDSIREGAKRLEVDIREMQAKINRLTNIGKLEKLILGLQVLGHQERYTEEERKKMLEKHEINLQSAEENQKNHEKNLLLLKDLKELLVNVGFADKNRKFLRNKVVEEESELLRTLTQAYNNQYQVGAMITKAVATKSYDDYLKRAAAADNAKAAALEATRRAEESEKKQRQNIITIAQVCQFLAKRNIEQLDPCTADSELCISALLSADKYLQLAVAMQEVRGDFSLGVEHVQEAIAENGWFSEDTEMIANITNGCEDWDGDGRIFRDIKWNYNEVFKLVDPEILAAYQSLAAL